MSWGHLCGWKFVPKEIERINKIQRFSCMGNTGLQAKNETVLLYKAVKQLLGYTITRRQEIGDCVSFGAACAVDHLKAVQIVLKKMLGDFKALTDTMSIYALSRVEIGKGIFSGDDGSSGAMAAEACRVYGTLLKQTYGKYDLGNYTGAQAKQWGETGLPDELEPNAHEHLVSTVTQCFTVEDVKAAITNGYPVTFASNQGFTTTLDNNGFCWPQGNWGHQMCIIGWRNDLDGYLFQNSWGDYLQGPKYDDIPIGSFFVKGEVVDDVIKSGADCWAFNMFQSYEPQDLTLRWM